MPEPVIRIPSLALLQPLRHVVEGIIDGDTGQAGAKDQRHYMYFSKNQPGNGVAANNAGAHREQAEQ